MFVFNRSVPSAPRANTCTVAWLLHDIVITNIVWYIAYKQEFVGGVVYCPMIVQ